jgi:hypothetical protein
MPELIATLVAKVTGVIRADIDAVIELVCADPRAFKDLDKGSQRPSEKDRAPLRAQNRRLKLSTIIARRRFTVAPPRQLRNFSRP